MIAATPVSSHCSDSGRCDWRRSLSEAIRDPAELCAALGLEPSSIGVSDEAARDFPLLAPRSFVARMRRADPRDPLLLQVLPVLAERTTPAGYTADPVGDLASDIGGGVLHKYEGRALLVATGACAVHCRYCFRRNFPYGRHAAAAAGWEAALQRLSADESIEEVILSGGDPLSLSDRRLTQLTDGLQRIPHVKRLRLHTRFPIVLPERVDVGLLRWLSGVRLRKVVVIHANHAREIDAQVVSACQALASAGAILLNQSVLLAGVNDSVEDLAQLSEALFDAGVLPYYLHVLDKVQGAAHFDVDEARAITLHAGLRARLPGYLTPRLVREIAGAPAKTPLGPL